MPSMRTRWFLYAWLLAWGLASTFLSWFSYESYWRWRCCFEDGRYFDGSVVHHDGAFVTMIPAVFSWVMLALGIAAGIRTMLSQVKAP